MDLVADKALKIFLIKTAFLREVVNIFEVCVF
jgi:hypothetical protein